jgi:DNA-binding transcriptional LysR family regulator
VHNLRHLRYVVEAARLGSITHASRLLRVSQPAISAAIRGLEVEFRIRIFVRSPSQGLALTPSGRSFVNRARELLENAIEFEQLFSESDDGHLSGRLELACYASSAPLLVPPMIQAFSKAHPSVTYLKDGTADLGLTYDIYLDNDIEVEEVAPLTPFIVVSKKNPLAKKKMLSLKEIVDEPLILLDSPGMRDYFYSYFSIYDLKPRVLHRPKTYELVRGLLEASNGYCIALVKIKNDRSYDGESLVNIEIEEPPPKVNLVIASLKGYRLGRLAKAFLDECKNNLQTVATGVAAKNQKY